MRIFISRSGAMNRRDLIKKLENNGWWKAREGDNHTIYTNGKRSEPIPRHKEINEITAKAILKRAGLK
jgi:mRNA interferase HicA